MFDITDRVVVVTGAARGLGATLAGAFAAAGARVVLSDVRLEALEATTQALRVGGATVAAVPCDVSLEDDVDALATSAQTIFGALDVWINNAGINIPKPAEQLTFADWNRIVTTNLGGTFLGCRAAGRLMLERGAGCIINIGSIHGHVGSYVHRAAAYNAAKAGVINLTRSLALEWGERGIRVNAISPGPLATELMTTRLADPDYRRKSLERLALKRVGTPDDVVGAAIFLATPAAHWITGHTLAVDGGWLAA
jgi:NAD(P)-dependent dehydrogenase (short-subunit alcohol dehydrogenase family)